LSRTSAPERGSAADPIRANGGSAPPRPVTARQLEILSNVARGKTNRQIGEDLGISERTVRNHMRSILQRLSSSDRTHAVVLAIGRGWIPIPIEPELGESSPIEALATPAAEGSPTG
jgi:DNA-binding NarL/FixJ family response regulator